MPIIDKVLSNKIEFELNKICELLINEPVNSDEGIGLYSGIAGKCLLMAENYIYTQNEVYFQKLNQLLSFSIDYISNGGNINHSFSSGISGWAWMFQYLVDRKIIDSESNIFLESIDNELSLKMEYLLVKNNDIDPINGALSIARYFLYRKNKFLISSVIDHLDKEKTQIENEIKWKNKVYGKKETFCYDLSLSHGMAGIIYFLLECYKNGIQKDKCFKLIRGAINFLLNNLLEFDTNKCYFPSKVDSFNKAEANFSRLSWCYGDLGIFYILYQVGVALNDKSLKKISINGLLKNTERRDFNVTKVMDAGFCHGSSGIAFIYYKMWLITNIKEFYNTSIYWLNITLNYGGEQLNLKEYKFFVGDFEERGYKEHNGLLEGLAGVGLVYSAFLNSKNFNWDNCFMLN